MLAHEERSWRGRLRAREASERRPLPMDRLVELGIGDEIEVRLVKPGREADQAVGYFEDGTMVVVESAGERIVRTQQSWSAT